MSGVRNRREVRASATAGSGRVLCSRTAFRFPIGMTVDWTRLWWAAVWIAIAAVVWYSLMIWTRPLNGIVLAAAIYALGRLVTAVAET